MSTRCNLKVTDRDKGIETYLYRHCDGYLAATGADVARCVRHYSLPEMVNQPELADLILNWFRAKLYEPTALQPGPRFVYETAEEVQGDIQHFYWIEIDRFGSTPEIRIHYAEGYGDKLEDLTYIYTLPEFIDKVNADRRATNNRIDVLNRQEGTHYDHYKMIRKHEPVTA